MSWSSQFDAYVKIEKLQHDREEAISRCIQSLEKLLANYEIRFLANCPRRKEDCDAFVLGSLIRSLKLEGLYPLSVDVFNSRSISSVVDILDKLKLPSLCRVLNEWGDDSYYSLYVSNMCGAAGAIKMIAKSLATGIVAPFPTTDNVRVNNKRELPEEDDSDPEYLAWRTRQGQLQAQRNRERYYDYDSD